ncbi:uncharacterized protein L969DRAFT_90240 [Mixia osmundae IAM 14324]|uniref:uncharacterized protein n=1 Tax=Mixia osmundae (strain CBS 9802 / IAM 14324 / JCM 22182 / KY 12970) TaxID=764103 RepID=UPI0004A54706|nr:uncharacterized protein L969DRAFT_90240 [Mixia osmundae IAM 14324]KEI37168.1 hypothetical protein L969DRAFT_90240 [Mixia osmundae IAM 14324]
MGHGSDKLYITHSEWTGEFGDHSAGSSGAKAKRQAGNYARLPYDCCALSLKPFDIPMATLNGTIYDLTNIIPYLRKHGTDPATGEKLAPGDLIKLNFFKNTQGEYFDPVTYKIFTEHTPLVAIRTSGNVFSKESVDRLNVKPRHWNDLVSDEKFTKDDIIVIQDPHNPEQRDFSQFHYRKHDLSFTDEDIAAAKQGLSGINVSAVGGANLLLRKVARSAPAIEDVQPGPAEAPANNAVKQGRPATSTKVPYNASAHSTGKTAASLTSTAFTVSTKTERALIDEEEFMFNQIKGKGYIRITTNLGALNVELFCDKAPRTCYNMLMLSRLHKYDDTLFHRSVPGFMIQGGDPTGTGRGGDSFWGPPFADEYGSAKALKHDDRGILSMANHGPNTNTSQFFLTFKATPHLNGKHTVFGRLVGGQDVLDKMEKIAVEKDTNKPLRPIKIIDVAIFKDPFEEYKAKLEKQLARDRAADPAEARKERDKDRTTVFGTQLGEKALPGQPEKTANGFDLSRLAQPKAGVGKYLQASTTKASRPLPDEMQEQPAKKKRSGGFGDFSAW